jgi:ABC-type uncharacterized transport system permease subunit
MSENHSTLLPPPFSWSNFLRQMWNSLKMPLLAILTAFILGAVVILITSGSFTTVFQAYEGMIRGAFIKQRGFSESLVATVPYILLSLAGREWLSAACQRLFYCPCAC